MPPSVKTPSTSSTSHVIAAQRSLRVRRSAFGVRRSVFGMRTHFCSGGLFPLFQGFSFFQLRTPNSELRTLHAPTDQVGDVEHAHRPEGVIDDRQLADLVMA